MLKKALILLLISTLSIFANVSKTFSFRYPVVANQTVYLEGCRPSIVPFAPCLPSKPVTLRLPVGEEAVAFEVEYGKPTSLSGSEYIAPFLPAGIITNPPPKNYFRRESSVYSVNAFYPSEVKSPRFFTHYRYGHPIFIASIRPVQYNPVSGELRFFKEITVNVKTKKTRTPLPAYKMDAFIKSQLQLEVDNPESLEGLEYTKRDGDDYEYALVTTEQLKDSWGDFVDFNKRRGLRTKTVTIEYINANFPGSHQSDKLKNYLIQEYTDHYIVYVMLGGDDNISTSNQIQSDAITHKSYYAEFKDYGVNHYTDEDIAADMFYETLEGQELEDLEWELYAARFPADDNTELQRMITKTMGYSEEPVTSVATKCIISGEEKWPNINGGTCYGKDQMIALYGLCDMNNYTTNGFPDAWTITELYERDGSWSKNDMINGINSGQNIVYHTGHSNNFMIMKLWLSENDVDKLTNTAYFIGYTTGCYPGAWDNRRSASNADFYTGHYSDDCINEEFMCGTDKGSVAFISNTRYGLGDDGHASPDGSDGSTVRFMRYLLDAIFGQKMHHLAVMHAYSKWINKQEILNTDINSTPYYGQMAYCAYELNVLGDPALSIWTATPQTLQANHPTTISSDNFSWDTQEPYTWVALLDKDGNEILCTQQSGVDGKIEITSDDALKDYITANPDGMLKINVKAHNYLPYHGDIQIDANSISNDVKLSLVKNLKFFNDRITYSLPYKGKVTLSVFNSKGSLVKSIVRTNQSGKIALNSISSGIYYLQLKFKDISFSKRFIISR